MIPTYLLYQTGFLDNQVMNLMCLIFGSDLKDTASEFYFIFVIANKSHKNLTQ